MAGTDSWTGIGMQRTRIPMHKAGLLGGWVHLRCRMAHDGSSGIRKMQENNLGCAWCMKYLMAEGKCQKTHIRCMRVHGGS